MLTNYFDIAFEEKQHNSIFNIYNLIDDIFENKWCGEDKWNKFLRTYSSKDCQKETLLGCIERLKKNKPKEKIKYRELAELFGITENNIRQRIHVLGINWRNITKL